MIARDEFARLVRDALTNLYDPVHLQTHRLAAILSLEPGPGETIGEALRSALREAIETLKPVPSMPVTRPEWVAYRVLWLHYVRSLTAEQVCEELNISIASFYRRQREALTAINSVLWERYQKAVAAHHPEESESPDSQVRDTTTNLAETLPRESIHVPELMRGIEQTILPLAQQRHIQFHIHVAETLRPVSGTPSIVRQIILYAVAEVMSSLQDDVLELDVSSQKDEILFALSCPGRSLEFEQLPETSHRLAICRDLLDVYGGRIWTSQDVGGNRRLCLAVPAARLPLILVVDDDQRAVELYRRYLQEYEVLGARTTQEAIQAVDEHKPDLILLDVILPQGDGWTLLQEFQTQPDTKGIPVVVCSIIGQPDLATALGAVEVLPKPISQERLLTTIQRWLSLRDSAA